MAKKIAIRLIFGLSIFFMCNWIYSEYFYAKDVVKFSRVKNKIDSAFAEGEIIYMGESSNTSFNPWTDTLIESISDYLQLYIPEKKVTAITHESYHPGLFLKMLELLPHDGKKRTLIVTLNMRTCGPSAMFSGNEAANQQEALFYSNRLPLLTRIFLSLHYYDNRNEAERERLKFQYWRTQKLQPLVPVLNVKQWLDKLALSHHEDKWKHMADAYVKEFAFLLNAQNDRVKDLDKIVAFCNNNNVTLLFHILPENREYASLLFGDYLVKLMDHNVDFLYNRYKNKNVILVNNYLHSKGVEYTDQWYPTEHFNSNTRQYIAQTMAMKLTGKSGLPPLHLSRNNWPNPDITQPLADTMLREIGVWDFSKN